MHPVKLTSPGGHDGHFGHWRHLMLARPAAKLEAGLVQLDVAVQAAGGQLPTSGIDQASSPSRAMRVPPSMNVAASPRPQSPSDSSHSNEGCSSCHRPRRCRRPSGTGAASAPIHAACGVDAGSGTDRLESDRWTAGVGCRLAPRDDHRNGAIDGRITVIEAQRV